jgi:hypothetical protein
MNKEQALELLQGLGETAEEVAANLQVKGIRGDVMNAKTCPVSQWLKANGADRVATSTYSIYLHNPQVGNGLFNDSHVNTPKAVEEFIRMFDAGKFPALKA